MLLRIKAYPILFLAFFLSSCSKQEPRLVLEEVSYNHLPNFNHDDVKKALPALQKSCSIMLRQPHKQYQGASGMQPFSNWRPFCSAVLAIKHITNQDLQNIFKTYLIPYRATNHGDPNGLFTGYYEPLLRGAFKRHGPYQTPLYKKPIGPLATLQRSQIVAGCLSGKKLEIVYVDDPAEAFFLQIQGSGRVQLENGKVLHLAYASGNKQPYTPIGRILIDQGEIEKKDVSMQSIKKWLRDNPLQAENIMSQNDSYVFFKIKKTHDYPVGSQNVSLTPHRSLAIDSRFIALGTPIWLDLADPHLGELKKLVVAQDTGGAIKGPVRGDYFWGFGNEAGESAGHMKAKGYYYLLLPKEQELRDPRSKLKCTTLR